MRVLVFGGTGRTGRSIATEALRAGHEVVAFGRSATRASVPEGAIPLAGDVTNAEVVERAIQGVDAVVSCLSVPRAGPSPFAAVVGPANLHSASASIVLRAMERQGVRRLVKVSAQGVGDSAPRTGWGFRLLVAASNLKTAFADHAVADALVADSGLDWTIVRPPMLSDGPVAGVRADPTGVTYTWTRVARADVARWIVGTLDDPTWVHHVVSLVPLRT